MKGTVIQAVWSCKPYYPEILDGGSTDGNSGGAGRHRGERHPGFSGSEWERVGARYEIGLEITYVTSMSLVIVTAVCQYGGISSEGKRLMPLRRTALQIASQLPSNKQDALAVLRLTEEIVEKFFPASPQPARLGSSRSSASILPISALETSPSKT